MSRESRALVEALRAWALALIALSLAAPLLPEAYAWGLWPAIYMPTPWRWALAMGAAGLTLFGDRLPIRRLVAPGLRLAQGRWVRGRALRAPTQLVRLGIALAALLPFYLFRLRHLRWGDAYILIHAIPHPEARLTYTWQAPLDVFLHAKVWAFGQQLFGWLDPTPVYWLISALAGVVFVWTLWGLAGWLGRDGSERVLIGGLLLSLGLMQLFFGYIENYSLMTSGVLIYLFLALRAQRGEVALVWPAFALALTHAFHPSTIVLAPSLLYLAKGRTGGKMRSTLELALPYLLVFVGVVALMTAGGHGLDALLGADAPGGGDRNWFVPLFQTHTRWEHYTMFSLGHLADILNEQLLVAPAVWPGCALAVLFVRRRLPWRDDAFRFLLIVALLYLALTLTWNPDYGGQRDWDLFAPAALPAALLCAYTLARALPERPALRAAGWALITAQAFHTMLWVYQNTLPWMP